MYIAVGASWSLGLVPILGEDCKCSQVVGKTLPQSAQAARRKASARGFLGPPPRCEARNIHKSGCDNRKILLTFAVHLLRSRACNGLGDAFIAVEGRDPMFECRCRLPLLVMCLTLTFALPTVNAEEDLVPFGSEWLYYTPDTVDDFPGVSFELNWFKPGFDTNRPVRWTGPAPGPFQYGDVQAFDNTSSRFIREFGTLMEQPESGNRLTTYFLHNFTTTDAAENIGLDLLMDDGGKVFLDGEQIVNHNCCSVDGIANFPEDPDEFIAQSIGAGSEREYLRFRAPGVSLAPGEHTLAVSLHNVRPNDRDLGMSVRLYKDMAVMVVPDGDWKYFEGTEEPSGGTLDWASAGFDDASWNTGELGIGYEEDPDGFLNEIINTELPDMQNNFVSVYLRKPFDVSDAASIGELTLNIDYDDAFFAYVNGELVFSSQRHPNRDDPSEPIPFDFGSQSHESTNGDGNPGEQTTVSLADFPGLLQDGDNILAIQAFNTNLDSSDFFIGQVALTGVGGSIPSVQGDFNGNGELDVDDINLLVGESASGQNNAPFDLNADGSVNTADVTVWAKDLKSTWIGDSNLDGEFNSGDLVSIFAAGKFEQDADANWSQGDWTGDGRFNTSDLVAAFSDGGFEQGPVVNAVPEPSAFVLLALGLLTCCRRRRRQ